MCRCSFFNLGITTLCSFCQDIPLFSSTLLFNWRYNRVWFCLLSNDPCGCHQFTLPKVILKKKRSKR